MPINSIVHFSGIPIEKNKRNGMKQADHLKIARAIQKTKDEIRNTKWNGRKSVQEKVIEFLNENPEAAYQEFCERTGLG